MQAKDADDEDELFAVDQRGPDPQAASHVLPDTGRSAASTPPVAALTAVYWATTSTPRTCLKARHPMAQQVSAIVRSA